MRTNLHYVFFLFVLLTQVSCKSNKTAQNSETKPIADNSMTSVDWVGIYQGILPCADCEGIKTQIVLNQDFSYVLETQYLGTDKKTFKSKGNFKWNETGSKITLDNENNQIYQVGENILFHLDNDGNRITGKLADNYILAIVNTELTGKHWKLISLNGKPVQNSEKEAFMSFITEENRVHGSSSCNMFNGKYELLNGNRIKFSSFAMTKMACIGNIIEAEFMQIFEKTTCYALTSNELILQDEYKTTLAKFEADFFKEFNY